uniref:C2 domain-containing protein n=1 Tax=Compsopogon caeruleus TaxID=31354 RepID=A0A7S1TF43_9RHOD
MDVIGRSDPFAILYTRTREVAFAKRIGGMEGVGTRSGSGRSGSMAAMGEVKGRVPGEEGVAEGAETGAEESAKLHRRKSLPAQTQTHHGRQDGFGGGAGGGKMLSALELGWVEVGRTETIQNTLCPRFATSFDMAYFFEKSQEIRVELYDRDAKSEKLSRHDFLGSAETTLAEIVTARGQRLCLELKDETKKLRRKKDLGSVSLLAEEVAGLKMTVSLEFVLIKAKFRWMARKAPFFRISRAREGNEWVVVYTSKVPRANRQGPEVAFKTLKISTHKLNNGDPARPLKVEFFNRSSNGQHILLGSAETTQNLLVEHPGQPIPLIRDRKVVGSFKAVKTSVKREPTFLDYVFGGCDISLLVAIDFTASNGDPRKIGTLHFNDPHSPNEYELALNSVASTLAPYDSDGLIPAYGYGAKLPPNNVVSHCFALNGNPARPECNGLDGLMLAYRQALNNVTLSGPTVFSQILALARNLASEALTQTRQQYTILLILTDGIISDIQSTAQEIVLASSLPLSIVIVGVGAANFEAMEFLDADDKPLSSDGRAMKRDIVQFVPFRRFMNAPGRLAEEVLYEIPHQLLSYMQDHGFQPNPPTESPPNGSQVRTQPENESAVSEGDNEGELLPQPSLNKAVTAPAIQSPVLDTIDQGRPRYPQFPAFVPSE